MASLAEIPIYRVITAKVTFGNIHGLDQHVDFVTTIKSSRIPRNISSELLLNNNNAGADSDSSSYDSASSRVSKTTGSDAMCIVEERIFKIPGAYRCKNYYMPTGIDPSLIDTSEIALDVRGAHDGGSYRPRHHHYAQGGGADEDDILLQLAIQQSLALSGGSAVANQTGPDNQPNEDQLTAMEMLGHRPPGAQLNRVGGTQSLQEYHDRGNRMLNNMDDDLALQR